MTERGKPSPLAVLQLQEDLTKMLMRRAEERRRSVSQYSDTPHSVTSNHLDGVTQKRVTIGVTIGVIIGVTIGGITHDHSHIDTFSYSAEFRDDTALKYSISSRQILKEAPETRLNSYDRSSGSIQTVMNSSVPLPPPLPPPPSLQLLLSQSPTSPQVSIPPSSSSVLVVQEQQ